MVLKICEEQGISPTDYAYALIREDVLKRLEKEKMESSEKTNYLIQEVERLLNHYKSSAKP